MQSAALARLENLLQTRKLDGTLLRSDGPESSRPTAPTGVGSLDALLGGGWPRGELSELVGGRSSGRTGTMLQSVAAATARGDLVGLIDALDRFDPGSAEAAGVDLKHVLWVRGPACTVESARPGLLDRAVHQAIRAMDLIIRAGGFGLVVLDVADVPALFLRALPATTWMRLARANEGQQAAGVVLASEPVSRSARGVTVRLAGSSEWTGTSAQSRRLAGVRMRVSISGLRTRASA